DSYPRDGQSQSYVAGFAEVEVDTETGVVKVIDYVAMGDVGTILNARSLKGQLFGGSMLGLGHAKTQRWAYDHSRRADELRRQRGRHSRSGNTDGRARRRRTAGGRGLRRDYECDRGRGRRRHLQTLSGECGHHPHLARERRQTNARSVNGTYLTRVMRIEDCGVRIDCGFRRLIVNKSAILNPQSAIRRDKDGRN